MYQHRSWRPGTEDAETADRRTASLAAVAIILVLLIAGLFLVRTLRSKAAVEDCLMAGRRNCDTLVVGSQ
jgi:hypothetical protein